MKIWISRLLGVLLTLALAIGMLCLAVLDVGESEKFYVDAFTRYESWEAAGISREEAMRAAESFPVFLTGDPLALSWDVSVDGAWQPLFHDRELSHMGDVARLFSLAHWIALACGVCFVALLILLLWLSPTLPLRVFWHWTLGTLGAVLLLLGGVVLWGSTDFTSLFHAFHRLLFQNELWLMDPATDRMIRLMPQALFLDGAISAAWRFLLGLGLYLGGCYFFSHPVRKKHP